MGPDTPAVALTIAGTDSGGGAGIAADLKTFAANGVHGTFAVTVVTAQNTSEVRRVQPLDADLVGGQIDAVIADFDIGAVKTGLLYNVEILSAVADRAETLPHLIVDPVLVRRTGEPMLATEMVDAFGDLLFPHAELITPNIAEAGLLTGTEMTDLAAVERAASALHSSGVANVIVTGWLEGDQAVDVYVSAGGLAHVAGPRIESVNVHGSGCSFAATVAARRALGDELDAAIEFAKAYVARAIRGAAKWRLGSGPGPIDHG